MTRIAVRSPAAWTMALAGALTVALVAVALDRPEPPRPKRVTIDRKCVEPRHVEETCPSWARAALRVDHNAIVACSHGNYGQPAWFVHAFYQTTELWERYAIFADDGAREIASAVDRPSVFTTASFRAGGLDEVLVRYPGAHELMQLHGDTLTTHLVRDTQP